MRKALPTWLVALTPISALSCVLGLAFGMFYIGNRVHSLAHPAVALATSSPTSEGMMFFGSFAAAVGPGLIGANVLLWLLPPARKAFVDEAEGVPGGSFKEKMGGLAKVVLLLTVPGVAVALIGALEP